MFFKLLSLFALVAVALAAPKPEPQLLPYAALDYSYPAVPLAAPLSALPVASPYNVPLAYSPYSAIPGAYYLK